MKHIELPIISQDKLKLIFRIYSIKFINVIPVLLIKFWKIAPTQKWLNVVHVSIIFTVKHSLRKHPFGTTTRKQFVGQTFAQPVSAPIFFQIAPQMNLWFNKAGQLLMQKPSICPQGSFVAKPRSIRVDARRCGNRLINQRSSVPPFDVSGF